MAHYQHILVGVDLSDESNQVLDRAASLISAGNTRLSIAHIIEDRKSVV